MEESIVEFFEHWVEEFARAVEMFSGERPNLTHKLLEASEIAELDGKRGDFQWWEQESEDPQKFKAWIGAQEACSTALGDQGDGGDPKDLFQEMVSQANQGVVAVLSASFGTPVRFGGLAVNPPSALAPLRIARVSVNFKGSDLPALVVALEPGAAKILAGPEPTVPVSANAVPQVTAVAGSGVTSAMMERLMDLHLPVSVLLGQTVLPIRDALKISSGSLIELDRQLGDYVEVMVHGTVVARGEIVAIKGNYGVRIREVISRKDRFALKDAA